MLRLIIAAPFALVLVLFTLSNAQTVKLALWPTPWSVELPLSIVVLAAMAVAFLIGALFLWVSMLGALHRARRAEAALRRAQAELAKLGDGRPGAA